MWDTGKTSQIATEIRRYNTVALGICETHWTQDGRQRQGVALMISGEARNALIGWKSHGPRIIKASFKTKKEGITMNVIQCYAPTNYSNDDNKDQFYERHGLGERNETTWISPGHTTGNWIDHIYISKTFSRSTEDVQTRRGADMASDHHLVVSKMKLNLKKHWTAAYASVDLNIYKENINILKHNTNTISLDEETLEVVEFSTYLGGIIDE
ncbi:unnamed protein product [Schistosoma margrebowiei]|uniref:Uncharacterized protein n=1 Tax=Schistosoma margrebowiei TaxID=48269 RepID=A0A183LS84_9TREM|nr:unnamed protein product [Schistosoma margrebowiei]